MDSSEYAFKIVCLDENNPFGYKILDEVNKDNITEVCQYLKARYADFDMDVCKWVILPIRKISKHG